VKTRRSFCFSGVKPNWLNQVINNNKQHESTKGRDMTLLDTQFNETQMSENFTFAIDDSPEFVLSAMRCNDGNGTLSYLFFSDEFVDMARAKAICARCTSKADCLAGALARSEPWGVWGGELIEEGRIRTTKRPRGRPVTKSHAVLTITEVPLPEHWVA